MPTLQTTPWIDWTFPDQAYARNKVGYVWGHAQEFPEVNKEVGAANPFDAHDKAVALERIRNNNRKMLGQMGVLNTTERSQRYDNNASQSASHINARFETYQSQTAGGLRGGAGYDHPLGQFIPTPANGFAAKTSLNNYGADTDGNPPMSGSGNDALHYIPTITHALTGGTQYFFYSKEGQDYLENLRKRRIAEMGAIATGNFEGGPPKHIPVAPQMDEVDAVLEKVLDQFESGAFPNSIIDDLNRLQTAFVRVGSTIEHHTLAQYVQIIARLKVQVDRIAGVGAGPYQLDNAQKRTVRATGLVLDRLERLLLEINKHVNESQDVRQRAVAEINSRVLGTTVREQAPYGAREQGRMRRRQAPLDFLEQPDIATRGEIERRQRRIPLPLPDAQNVTPAGEPPVRPF